MAIPKRVLQIRKETCWAAAMECWTHEAVYYPDVACQNGLADVYGDGKKGKLNSSGSKIIDFCDEFWLSRETIAAGQLTLDHIEKWLGYAGYFMYAAQTNANIIQAVLIYNYYDGAIFGMNPDPNQSYPYIRSLVNLPTVTVFYLDEKKVSQKFLSSKSEPFAEERRLKFFDSVRTA